MKTLAVYLQEKSTEWMPWASHGMTKREGAVHCFKRNIGRCVDRLGKHGHGVFTIASRQAPPRGLLRVRLLSFSSVMP